MGSSRKRPRTKPPSVEESPNNTQPADDSPPSTQVAGKSSRATKAEESASTPLEKIRPEGDSSKEIKSKSSWYGTWPRKSTASTQVARETILADKPSNGTASADLSAFTPKRPPATVGDGRPPSMYLGKSKETSDVSMGGTLEEEIDTDKERKTNNSSSAGETPKTETSDKAEETSGQKPTHPEPDPVQKPAISSGWLGGWLGRPAVPPSPAPDASISVTKPAEESPAAVQDEPQPEQTAALAPAEELPKTAKTPTASTSWFGLWSTAAPSTAKEASKEAPKEAPKEQIPVKIDQNDGDTVMEDAPSKPNTEPTAGSSWAFWSTDTSKKTAKTPGKSKEVGQLAVAGEVSQNQPEPAKAPPVKEEKKTRPSKRGRTVSVEVDETSKSTAQPEAALTKVPSTQTPVPLKVAPPNLIIPSVRNTYRLMENPSILQQIARLILHGQQKPVKHVFLAKELPKIKKAIAIGIHGLFPAPLLRTVIGQPTGTSVRFANHAAAAIRRWADQHGCFDCEIEKVALEGEGKIAERVDNLWKLLLNWIEHVRKADFILVACHSQGVPVAVMLVAKLIEFGVVSTSRIGVCAMAGVSLGPFADYKSRLFSGSAGELFDFADPESAVSKKYEDALRISMKYGVRVTYCGSIDDQLVSMESSIFSPASHPYIYRAVFVDGRIHAPNFLSHLIGFALKLRNLGVSDHGLIRELSAPLAGSLYTGEGHSRLYDDERVYDLAVEYALETTSVGDVPLEIKKYQIPTNNNPYVLPWIMRGLLEEDFVKTELDTEVTELLKQFDEWKPATKVLKDVKYRLEAVRSKL